MKNRKIHSFLEILWETGKFAMCQVYDRVAFQTITNRKHIFFFFFRCERQWWNIRQFVMKTSDSLWRQWWNIRQFRQFVTSVMKHQTVQTVCDVSDENIRQFVTSVMKHQTNHYGGAESLRGVQKSPNNVTSTFFNTVHLLLKELTSEHGGRQTSFLPQAPSNLVTPLVLGRHLGRFSVGIALWHCWGLTSPLLPRRCLLGYVPGTFGRTIIAAIVLFEGEVVQNSGFFEYHIWALCRGGYAGNSS